MPVIGHQIRYYYSSMGNNAMFEHPVEIHDRKTLTKFIHDSVIDISMLKPKNKVEDSEWKFYTYLHYEIVVYQTNLTIGNANAVALPEHFYNKSNEKNLIKFDNYDDNLCFWRCLAVFDELINQSGGKIDYRRFEKPAKNMFKKFITLNIQMIIKVLNIRHIVLIMMMKIVKNMIKRLKLMKSTK